MTDPDGELASRVRSLEREVARLHRLIGVASSDAGAARVLASGADRDVSELREALRAHTAALTALRETQLEQDRRLGRMDQRLDRMEQRTADGFATMQVGMQRIVELLEDRPAPS